MCCAWCVVCGGGAWSQKLQSLKIVNFVSMKIPKVRVLKVIFTVNISLDDQYLISLIANHLIIH